MIRSILLFIAGSLLASCAMQSTVPGISGESHSSECAPLQEAQSPSSIRFWLTLLELGKPGVAGNMTSPESSSPMPRLCAF